MILKITPIIFTYLFFVSAGVYAQDANYSPPPMFGASEPEIQKPEPRRPITISPPVEVNTQPIEAKPDIRNRARISRQVDDLLEYQPLERAPIRSQRQEKSKTVEPTVVVIPEDDKPVKIIDPAPVIENPSPTPVFQPAIDQPSPVSETKEVLRAPLPAQKPPYTPAMAEPVRTEITAPNNIPAPEQKPKSDRPTIKQAEAIQAEPPEQPRSIPPQAQPIKDTKPQSQQGVVKGPKTMPAVPAENVATEILVENPQTETILERAQKQPIVMDITEPLSPSVNAPLDVASVPGFDKSLRHIFTPGQTDIQDDLKAAISASVLQNLRRNPSARVQIQSYASSVDQGNSSDRRISLNRALAIRSYLIEQNIEPNRIDVRALGSQTDEKPVDRIDLIISEGNTPL